MILNLTFRTLALRQCPIGFDKRPTLKMSAVFKTLGGGQFSISSKLINPVKTLPPFPPPPPPTHTNTHIHYRSIPVTLETYPLHTCIIPLQC